MNDAASRVFEFEKMLPGSRKPTKDITDAMFTYFCDLKLYAKDIAERQGIDTSATVTIDGDKVPVYDFGCSTYDQVHADADAIVGFIDAAYPDACAAFPRMCSGFDQPHDWKYYVGKMLGLLGFKEVWEAVLEILEAETGALMAEIGAAVAAKDWRAVQELLRLLLDFLMSSRFVSLQPNATKPGKSPRSGRKQRVERTRAPAILISKRLFCTPLKSYRVSSTHSV